MRLRGRMPIVHRGRVMPRGSGPRGVVLAGCLGALMIIACFASPEPCRAAGAAEDTSAARTIPFTLAANKIILPARVNGSRELKLILDTGMQSEGILVMKRSLTAELRIERPVMARIGGAGGDSAASAIMADSISFSVGGVEFRNQRIVVLQGDRMEGFPNDGVIGYSLFGQYVVEIDYDASVIRLHDPGRFTAAVGWASIPITFKQNQVPWVDATINVKGDRTAPVSLYIDLASSEALEMLTRERMKFQLPDKLTDHYLGRGLSGDIHGRMGRVARLELGPFTLRNVLAAFTPAEIRSRQPGADGVLSNNALRRFNVVFDYAGRRLWLKPNSHFGEAFK